MGGCPVIKIQPGWFKLLYSASICKFQCRGRCRGVRVEALTTVSFATPAFVEGLCEGEASPFLKEIIHYLENDKDNYSAARVCPVQAAPVWKYIDGYCIMKLCLEDYHCARSGFWLLTRTRKHGVTFRRSLSLSMYCLPYCVTMRVSLLGRFCFFRLIRRSFGKLWKA